MSRFVVCYILLVLVAVVTSIPAIPNDFVKTLVIDVNPDVQSTLQVQDPFGWKNLFGLRDTGNKNDSLDVTDLFTASQLTVVPTTQVGDLRRYVIGKRVANDRLVGHGADGKRWTTPQDVTLALKYPTTGQGAIVTYAEIDVNQSSVTGKAYVIAGGVGQRIITIVVEAHSTSWFYYTASIYGL